MTTQPNRILVYDGDCSLCVTFSRLATRRWLVGDAQRRAHDSFAGEDAVRLAAAGVHNELAVIAPSDGEIRTGYDGLLWLLEGGWLAWAVPLLRFAPVRWLLRHDYRLVAYNRRILAPPARSAACACDPDMHLGYRWAFLAAALLWTGVFAALGGLLFWSVLPFWPDMPRLPPGPRGSWLPGPIVLTGWLAAALVTPYVPRTRRLDYLGHMAWTFAAMVLPLILAATTALSGLLLASAGLLPFISDSWQFEPGYPALFGAIAWGLALPIAIFSSLWRLPRVGLTKRAALFIALVSWLLPTAQLFFWLPTPFHGT